MYTHKLKCLNHGEMYVLLGRVVISKGILYILYLKIGN